MSERGGKGVGVEAVVDDFVEILTSAATRIQAEHRRRAVGWVAAASLLGLAGIPLLARGRHAELAGVAAGVAGALARAGRHRRLAALVRPG